MVLHIIIIIIIIIIIVSHEQKRVRIVEVMLYFKFVVRSLKLSKHLKEEIKSILFIEPVLIAQ
jgi:hypothetical protein